MSIGRRGPRVREIKRSVVRMYLRGLRFASQIRSLPAAIHLLLNWSEVARDHLWGLLGWPTQARVLRLRNGLSFQIHTGSAGLYEVFTEIFYTSVYDGRPGFGIRRADTVIDIGANVGFFTVRAASLAPEGTVYALEPCSPHYALLSENVRRNSLPNVVALKQAVWKTSGRVPLYYTLATEPNDTSLYHGKGSGPAGEGKVEEVATISLDELFERYAIGRCDFLKLDCEGAEYEILRAASDRVWNATQRIALEWHKFDPSHSPEELAELLKAKGFSVLAPSSWASATGYLYGLRAL